MKTNDKKLDYGLQTPQERNQLTQEIIDSSPEHVLKPVYLEKMANYILDSAAKDEKKEKHIITDNHLVTINKREISYEGLVDKFENGEDGVYSIMSNDKNVLFMPKKIINAADVQEIPGMKELVNAIAAVEEQLKTATGKQRYALKKQSIEMRKDQYILKSGYKPTYYPTKIAKSVAAMDLSESYSVDQNTGLIKSNCLLNFLNPEHVSAILCNYSAIKEEAADHLFSDAYFMMQDFDKLADSALKDFDLLYQIMIKKIDGASNIDIQKHLEKECGDTYTVEYISNLWRKKIPRMIAEKAQDELLIWYYTFVEAGKWKKCSRCGEIKLAHNRFYSKNGTSKDGWYSMCKCCRNKAAKDKNK